MKKIIFLLAFLISGVCFAQNPDPFWDGIRTKLIQPDTLSTFDRDALTPKLGTILYHKDEDVSNWEQWDGTDWKTFGEGISRDSLIVQSSSSFGNIYNYWEGTEAQMDALLLSDPNFFDDILWICIDCPQQGSGGTANQFVMGDGSFKNFIDDDTFVSATSTNIPSASSVQAYVDNGFLQKDVNETTTGTLTAANFILSSDKRLKENFQSLGNGYYSFNFKGSNEKRYGVIAQEVQKYAPELVSEGVDGYLKVAYIDLLIKKVAELEKTVKELKNK